VADMADESFPTTMLNVSIQRVGRTLGGASMIRYSFMVTCVYARQFGTGMNSPAMKVVRSVDNQKQRWPQTVRPHHPKTGTRKQNTSNTYGRLSRVDPTFDQLLAKYMKKKVVTHDWPINEQSQKCDLGKAKVE
jgi:hypothetical protein